LTDNCSIHNLALCGHVEEVVVSRTQQKTGLGLLMMESLQTLGRNLGVKKMILNCSDHNIPFYQKCGFEKAGQQMSLVLAEGESD
jgi:glucosamine-phosphate N-acetyltransferase